MIEGPTGLPQPRRILTIGYTTFDQAFAKGIIWDDPASVRPWYNPGKLFEQSFAFVPFGKDDIDRNIAPEVRYIEWKFAPTRMRHLAGVFRLLAAVRYARRLRSELGIDVIRLGGPHFPALIGLCLRPICHVPMLQFIEGFWERLLPDQTNIPRWVKAILPSWYRIVYRAFDAYTGTPSVDPDYYVSRGMDRKRIAPWMHELDLIALENSASNQSIPPSVMNAGHPRLVAVGRLHPEKRALDLVKTLKIVQATHPTATLVLVGDGQDRQEIEREGGNAVIVTGSVSQSMALAIVKASDIYTAPMQGNALVEAMAAGMPIVAYDHAWHSNLVTNEVSAILVKDHDVEAMASAVNRLLDDKPLSTKLGHAARERAYSKYGPAKVAEALAGGYRLAWDKYWNFKRSDIVHPAVEPKISA